MHGAQFYDPTEANARCTTPPAPTLARCLILYGSPSSDLQNDVIEYWFGAFLTNDCAGFDDDGNNLDVIGTDDSVHRHDDDVQRRRQRRQPVLRQRLVHLDERDPASERSIRSSRAGWRPSTTGRAGPSSRTAATKYAYSQIADQSFKRFTHTVNVPAGGANMSFWTSYNTESDWDHLFVEAHTVGQDDWTTLEDLNGQHDPDDR